MHNASKQNDVTADSTDLVDYSALLKTNLGKHNAPTNIELNFDDEPPPLAQYEAYKCKKPLLKSQLIAAARELIKLIGGCDIHAAYWFAKKHYNTHCSRDWLPAFAREIAAECDDLRTTFKTRSSRFDGEELL